MNTTAATMLPLKAQRVVTGTKYSYIEGIDDAVVEEPDSDSWILLDSFVVSTSGLRIIRTDETGKLWQLEVCRAVGEEESTKANCVHHGN